MVVGTCSMRIRLRTAAGIFAAGLFAFAPQSGAALIGVNDPNLSTLGVAAQIIAAPANVRDDAGANQAQQGFNEVQNHVTTQDFEHDFGTIAAGTTVDSHLIYLNTTDGPNAPGLVSHEDVEWIFSGEIIGIMSDPVGAFELASSPELGAPGTLYPGIPFTSRGLELGGADESLRDSYSLLDPFTLRVEMHVLEPGDWIRVITTSTAMAPEPSTAFLLGLGLFGLAGVRRAKA